MFFPWNAKHFSPAPHFKSFYCYIDTKKFFCLHPSLYLLVSWAWWDWPLTRLTNHRPSVLWHCWMGHVTRKTVSKMTYNVSSGTLNSTIPYPLDKVMVSARSGTVWAGHAYWYFFFDVKPYYTYTHTYLCFVLVWQIQSVAYLGFQWGGETENTDSH